jgi:hypothetical protein
MTTRLHSPAWGLGELLWLLLLALPAAAQAQFTFTTNNGAITITGYTGQGGSVTIPDTTNGYSVTSIGNSAFFNCSSVTNVTIPNSVTNIDVQAFTECGLTSITIPDSVTAIGQSAFLECSRLVSLTIGNNVMNIGDDAFSDCSSLGDVHIPKNVTNINSTAFNECSSLTNITVDAENPAYSSVAGVLFDKNQTKLVDYPCGMAGGYSIPSGVTSIGDFAFPFCYDLTNIIIPDSVTNIGQYAFYSCSGLINFTIPNNVTSLGQYAFSATSLTNIIIPKSITNIGAGAFAYCPRLMAITVDTNDSAYSSVAGVLFNVNQTTVIEFPYANSGSYFYPGSYTIPNGVTRIGDKAFLGCFLSSITIPDSVTSIGNEAFGECSRIADLTIPYSVTNIGDGAFEATSLTSITIPDSVTTLGWFGYCPSLRTVYFRGNAPGQGNGIPLISFLQYATAYYLPGTTGWTKYFQITLPTALWLPQVQPGDASFGVRTNQFGFSITWASGMTVVVEASTNLANPVWSPVSTNTLIGVSSYFSDAQWASYPSRFYRIRSP